MVMPSSSVSAWLDLEWRRPRGHGHFNHRRLPGRQSLLQAAVEPFRCGFDALRAKHFSDFGKAGIIQRRADLSALETRALVVLRRPQSIIDEHHYHDTNAIVHGSGEFGQGVHEAAITRNRHYR